LKDDKVLAAFVRAFVVAADEDGERLSRTRLKDFLDHDVPKTTCPYEFAGSAFHYFCVEDGTYNRQTFALKGVLSCLMNLTGHNMPSATRLTDLRTLLNASPAASDLAAWAKKAFPSN
jgi:hypothetical protein